MKKVRIFLAGMLTAALLGSTVVGALAASGNIVFNASAIRFKGQQISAKGEDYALPSGQKVPASITYVDANGGGTTYLPVRRFAELLGIEVSWDSASGSISVGKELAPVNPSEPLHLEDTPIKLYKIDGKYYTSSDDPKSPGALYFTAKSSNETLLFTRDIDIVDNSYGPFCIEYYFNNIFRLALMTDYEVSSSKNPYLDGILKIPGDVRMMDYFTCGIEDTIYTSASDSFTPMWVEYNGKRLEKQPKSDELTVVNGVRYQDGMVCMNDVLTYFGIDKTITVGEYQGLNYIEIK